MLVLTNLSRTYGDKTVVHPLTLEVRTGTVCVLIGPSGCGKSTILRMVAGLIKPTTGDARIGDTGMKDGCAATLRQRIGYVIQEGGLFPHLTAYENIVLKPRNLGWDAARIEKRIESLRDLTRFPSDALVRYPGELSGGQRQRVSLMRALFTEPELLLLDEPLGALDPLIRYELQCELKAIFEQLNSTALFVTHDLSEAAWFADHIVLMRDGRVVQQGSINSLADAPADDFVRSYLQSQRPVLS